MAADAVAQGPPELASVARVLKGLRVRVQGRGFGFEGFGFRV